MAFFATVLFVLFQAASHDTKKMAKFPPLKFRMPEIRFRTDSVANYGYAQNRHCQIGQLARYSRVLFVDSSVQNRQIGMTMYEQYAIQAFRKQACTKSSLSYKCNHPGGQYARIPHQHPGHQDIIMVRRSRKAACTDSSHQLSSYKIIVLVTLPHRWAVISSIQKYIQSILCQIIILGNSNHPCDNCKHLFDDFSSAHYNNTKAWPSLSHMPFCSLLFSPLEQHQSLSHLRCLIRHANILSLLERQPKLPQDCEGVGPRPLKYFMKPCDDLLLYGPLLLQLAVCLHRNLVMRHGYSFPEIEIRNVKVCESRWFWTKASEVLPKIVVSKRCDQNLEVNAIAWI